MKNKKKKSLVGWLTDTTWIDEFYFTDYTSVLTHYAIWKYKKAFRKDQKPIKVRITIEEI